MRGQRGRPLSTLIGRERELRLARALLQRPDVRLLTLRGPGGIGKTRLAQELAWTLMGDYERGAAFVELAGLHDPDHVIGAIAATLGVALGARDPTEAISEEVGAARMLIVLDNVEHLLACGPQVTDLLRRTPGLDVVATTRRALNVTGEHELLVGPLAWTGASDGRDAALTLFAERARAHDPDFELDENTMDVTRRICAALEGVPLSLELAAARLRALTPREVLAWLDRPFDALAGGAWDRPERLRSLRATLEWSCALLDEADRDVFLACGVFYGSFTLEALSAVTDRADFRERLSSLVEQSLVRRLDRVTGRYALLKSLRELAVEKLVAAGTLAHARDRHAAYYTRLAADIDARHEHVGWFLTRDALARVQLDLANLLGALAWWVNRGKADEALRLSTSLFRYWYSHGSSVEGCLWLERALTSAQDDTDPHLVVRAEAWLANLAASGGDHHRAEALLRSAIRRQQQFDDASFAPVLVNDLGFVLMKSGRHAEAETTFCGLLRDFGERGHPLLSGIALNALAEIMIITGRPAAALDFIREALRHHERNSNFRSLVHSHVWKGHAHHALGEMADAWRELLLAVELCVEHHLDHLLVDGLRVAAEWFAKERREEPAVQFMAASVTLRDHLNGTTLSHLSPELAEFRRAVGTRLTPDMFGRFWTEGASASWDKLLYQLRIIAMRKGTGKGACEPEGLALLTRREREVLALVQLGATDKRVAQALGISVMTASKHVANMLSKLGLHNRVALAHWASEHPAGPPSET